MFSCSLPERVNPATRAPTPRTACANTHAVADEVLLPSSAGPAATVHCSHDRSWEDKNDQVDKGFFEVIGTLQADGSIVSMTSVAMGDNLGALG